MPDSGRRFRLRYLKMQDTPLVSFIVVAYNQEDYIRQAIEGAFAQTYSPLEIILSDDCSTDTTFMIMQQMASQYAGPHRVILNRNIRNMGLGQHYNRVMEIASGQIIEIAAGDDVSLPWRTSDSVALLQAHPEATCVSLQIRMFENDPPPMAPNADEVGPLSTWTLTDFATRQGFFINAPGRAFRKFTHDFFGPIDESCPVEDGPSLLRCLLHGVAITSGKVGVLYRWNGRNISSPENIAKIRFAPIYDDYLNSVNIAFERQLIDAALHATLTAIFTRNRNRSALLEAQKSGRRDLKTLAPILRSHDFSYTERLRFLVKWILGRTASVSGK
jgi:glycosyltransferase involved in cell wall biosynthesis